MSLFSNDWQTEWGSAQSDFTTISSADSDFGGTLIEMNPPSNDRHAISNVPVGGITDPEILTLTRAPVTDYNDANGYCRSYVCGSGSEGNETAYFVAMTNGNWRLTEYDGGTLNNLGQADSTTQDQWWWTRLRAESTGGGSYDVYAKFWQKGNAEPSSWDIAVSPSTANITTSGWVGIGGYPGTYKQQWDWVGIADSGNTVPVAKKGPINWQTQSDWDGAQSEQYVHHEQPSGTDWAAADTLETGLATADFNGSALEVYLPLDETSGATLNDVTGNGYDATTVNSPTLGATGIGGTTCVDFGTSGDYAYYPKNIPVLDVAGGTYDSFTVSCWVYLDSFPSTQSRAWDLSGQMNVSLRADDQNDLYPLIFDGNTVYEIRASIATGNWYYTALVNDASSGSDATFYLGSPDDSNYSSLQSIGTWSANDPAAKNEANALGGAPDSEGGTNKQEWDGRVDEFQIHSRTRSQSKLADEYEAFL